MKKFCSGRLGFVLLFLLISPAVMRADVTITSGSVGSSYGITDNFYLNIQGPNLSLTACPAPASCIYYTTPLGVAVGGNSESVTFIPSQSWTQSFSPERGIPGELVYNGMTYQEFTVSMNFTAAPVSVPNAIATVLQYEGYGGAVSNVAFSMTGTITAYSDYVGGTVSQVVPISGTGTYNANGSGYIPPFVPGGPGKVSEAATYQFTPASGFILDTKTQGYWKMNYGGDGYQIAGGASQTPSYVAIGFPGASAYTWAGETSDGRALQNGPGSIDRIASGYVGSYGSPFSVNLNMVDGQLHRVGLYLLDWDNSSRVETITLTNADTGALIDSETFSNFQNGEYAAWNLSGNVNMRVTTVSGGSAVVNGIFFGPSGTPPLPPQTGAMAMYHGVNAKTIGNTLGGYWSDGYGTSGYMIAGGASQLPSNSQVSVIGALTYIWAGSTSDARALQTSPGPLGTTTGIAAAWTQYPGNSFSIDVNTTGGNVTLYLLDWDSTSRQETITIHDASTNALLSSVTLNDFQNGLYATWSITGNVVITVTPVASASGPTTPVVSGIFFD